MDLTYTELLKQEFKKNPNKFYSKDELTKLIKTKKHTKSYNYKYSFISKQLTQLRKEGMIFEYKNRWNWKEKFYSMSKIYDNSKYYYENELRLNEIK